MGIAPYGKPVYLEALKEVIQLTNDGLFKLNGRFFRNGREGLISYDAQHVPHVAAMYTDVMVERFGAVRNKDEPPGQHHKDLAASVQRMTEEVIFHLLNDLHKKTGLDNICIAGGVAQNSVANGKITRHTPFKNVYIPSAGHDAGISMGAALYVQHEQEDLQRQVIYSAYTGSHFSNTAIKEMLDSKGIKYA